MFCNHLSGISDWDLPHMHHKVSTTLETRILWTRMGFVTQASSFSCVFAAPLTDCLETRDAL
jgi:hypothetical protein